MGGKKSRESQIRASVKYNKAHDYFGIRPDKETGAAIRQAAAAAGQSVQRYILDAVQSRMEYDAWNMTHGKMPATFRARSAHPIYKSGPDWRVWGA